MYFSELLFTAFKKSKTKYKTIKEKIKESSATDQDGMNGNKKMQFFKLGKVFNHTFSVFFFFVLGN